MGAAIVYLILAIILGIIFPGIAILSGPKTRQLLLDEPHQKVKLFRATVLQLIILLMITLLPFLIFKDSLHEIGLSFLTNPFQLLALFAISFAGLWLISQFKPSIRRAKRMLKRNAEIQYLFPSNSEEYKALILVSFVAGISEEIVYRGFLFWYLSNHMPLIPAILLANLSFSLAHLSSTGFKNSLKAFILGLAFTGTFLLTQSLWYAILFHIITDIYSATLTYKSTMLITNSRS